MKVLRSKRVWFEKNKKLGVLPQVVPFLILFLIIALIFAREISLQQTSIRLVNQSEELIDHIYNAEIKLTESLSKVRAFIITENPEFLEGFVEDRASYVKSLKRIEANTESNYSKKLLNRLDQNLQSLLIYADNLIELERQGQDTEALIRAGRGRGMVNEARNYLTEIREEEMAIQKLHEKKSNDSAERSFFIAIITLLGTMIWNLRNIFVNNAYADRLQKNEAELREAEARLRGLLQTAYDSIVISDENGKISFVNDQVSTKFGYQASELIGKYIEVLIPDDKAELHIDQRNSYLKNPKSRQMGVNLILDAKRKDGSTFPVEIALSPFPSGKDKLEVAAIIRDITERDLHDKREVLLADVGEHITSLDDFKTLQTIADLCTSVIADWVCFEVNKKKDGVARIYSYSDNIKEMQILTDGKFLDDIRTDIPIFHGQISQDFLRSHIYSKEKIKTVIGAGIKTAILVPIKVRDEQIGNLAMICTRRSFDENDLNFALDLAKRTSLAIENAELHQLATDAVKQRENIVSVVSHDLKNPLGAIKLSVQMFTKKVSDDLPKDFQVECKKRMNQILTASDSALKLITDLMDITKIQSGNLVIIKKTIKAKDIVKKAHEIILPIAEEKNINFTTECEYLGNLECDEERILQVLSNLLGNAIKYTPAHGEITLSLFQRGDRARFVVRDNGPGISPENEKNIFEKFWMGNNNGVRENLGLGLSIAKGIVDSHDGEIWVETELGKGTAFFFEIPTYSHIQETPMFH